MQALVATRHTAFEEQLLPLAHHAVAEVIQHHHLHRGVVGGGSFQFAQIHANAGVTVNVDNQLAWVRKLRANGRRQAEAHGAHAAASQPQARLAEVKVLRGPHLVLAHARGNDGVALRQAIDRLDDGVRLDHGGSTVVVESVHALQFGAMRMPLAVVRAEPGGLAVLAQHLQSDGHFTDMAPAHPLHFVDFAGVDVEVRNETRTPRKLRGHTGHAVVEARTHSDEGVAVFDGVVGKRSAVHTEHVHGQRAGGIHRTNAHQRGHHRNAEGFCKAPQFAGRTAIHHATAHVEQRALRLA